MAWDVKGMKSLTAVFLNLANVLVILFLTVPLLALVFASVQTERTLIGHYMDIIPRELTSVNFEVIMGRPVPAMWSIPKAIIAFPRAFGNSLIVATSVTLLTLVFASLMAYAVARLRVRWTQTMMYVNLATRLVPIIILMVPLFVTLRRLQLLNTLPGIIVTEVGFLLPYAVWILVAYFLSLPAELEDAARIDGCTRMGCLLRIVLPLSAPGLAATAVIVFLISWNELLIPLIVTSKQEMMTVPVLLSTLVSDFHVYYTLMAAISLVGLLPSAVLALLLQKYVVRGLTAGALKG